MNLQQGDILLRKTSEGETLWLSERLVTEVCELNEPYLKITRHRYKSSVLPCFQDSAILPDTGKGWRWARLNNRFYYAYANIPNRMPQCYRSKFGTEASLKEALKEQEGNFKLSLKEAAKRTIAKAVNAYETASDTLYYQFKASVLFPPQKARELAKAKAWCSYIRNQMATEGYKSLGLSLQQDFLLLCTEILQEQRLEGLKVSNAVYLRNKIIGFPSSETEQLEYLVNGRYGNDNACIVGKTELVDEETGQLFRFDAHQALMYYGYMNPGGSAKESRRQIYVDFYKPGIEELGYGPVAYRTFCKHLDGFDKDMLQNKERHGVDYHKKSTLAYIPTKPLQYAHSLFAGDGSGTVSYQYYDGKKLKTKKLYVMLISDVASRKIVGWSVAPKGQSSEDYGMLENAVKMAVNNCGRQTMFEFVSDNHPAFTSEESIELLNLVFNKVRTIEPGNSQANPAETAFRLFKQTLKKLYNFHASSWNVGTEGQSNPDYFDIKSLPTYEDAVLQFRDLVKAWNESPLRDGVSPQKRFENKNPKCRHIDPRVLRKIYGNKTKIDLSYMRGFVRVSKTQGYEYREDYLFEIPDLEAGGAELLSRMTGHKSTVDVQVCWDENMADLYNMEGTYIMSCMPAELSSGSHAEATSESMKALGHHLRRKERITEAADAFREEIKEVYAELPYLHQMKAGGNKESYNNAMEEESIKKQLLKKRFDPEEW